MTYFLKSGSRFNVTTKEGIDLHESLPVGTYTVKFDEMAGMFYLDAIEGFSVRGKIYGDTTRNAYRILNTFEERPASTGVMLSGEQGSGKTLLAKILSLEGQQRNYPTIVINQPWHGERFNSFMQMIEQPTIVIFDEFEKVYDRDDQEKLLTLLDGVYPSKKLYIITCNDKWRVNEHMRNRPGRIYYRLEYTGLDTDFIAEYCNDNLQDKRHIEAICRISMLFSEFNFDMLKAMVEEMNRYGESPQETMRMINAKPELSNASEYKITLAVNGVEVPDEFLENSTWKGNPLSGAVSTYYRTKRSDDVDSDEGWRSVKFSPIDLHKVDTATGNFYFKNPAGVELTMVKVVQKNFDYLGAF